MEWMYGQLDRWAVQYQEWRKAQRPETVYISMSSVATVMIRDAHGKLLMSYTEDGTLCMINHSLGIKTVVRSQPCEKK